MIVLEVREGTRDSGATGTVPAGHPNLKREVTAPGGERQAWLIPALIGPKFQGQPL